MVAVEGENIACTTGATFNGTTESIIVTCKDNNGAVQRLAGSRDWNISVSGNAKYDASFGLIDLQAAWIAGSEVDVTFGTGETGDPYLTGPAQITSFSIDGPLNAPATWSVTFEARGAIVAGTFT